MHGRTWLRRRTDGAAGEPPLRPAAVFLAALAGLLVLTAAPAAAQTVIDDFSTAQATLTDPPGGASSVPTAGADILGMHRDLTVDLGTGAGPVSAGVAGGMLSFGVADTTPDSEGSATVTWDGDTDPNVLAPTGLGGVDLTTGGATALRIRAGSGAFPVSAVVQIYTDAGNVSRAGLVIPVGATVDRFISFATFVAVQGAGADLTDVGAITLKLSAREASVTIDLVDAVDPALAAAKADALTTDVDVDTRVDPGDTLTYTITLTNTGGEATTVSLADMIDANTTLVGTPRTSPIAADDQYTGLSGMPLDTSMPGVPSLLDNDVDVDGDSLMAVATTGQATTRGGSVDVAADGNFVYTPPVGFFGVDSFAYTLQAVAGDPTTTAAGSPIGPFGATAYVVIEPIPPTVNAGGVLAYTENDMPKPIDITITVMDPDSPNLAGATAQITGNYAMGEDVLSFTDMLGITGVFSPATGTMTLTGTAPQASYQTALQSVKYENTSEDPSTPLLRTVTWIVDDGFATSAPDTSTIQITAVNDPPVLTAGGTLAYTENDPPTAIDTTITATDPDSNLQSATAQITANYVMGQDVLSFTDMLGITGVFAPATGTMTLTGSSSVANYQTALRSVAYNNTSENPSASPRTVTWIATDGPLSSTPVFSTITVTPVNDPPVAGADSWDTVGNTRLVVDLAPLAIPHVRDTTPSTFGVLDNDADPAEGNAFAVTAIVGCADLTPPFGDSPLCATANGGSVVMEANGRFTYTPPAGNNADDTFMYTVTDDGAPPASSNGTVTIHFFERVWYVKNDSTAGGLGRSHDPFDTLVEAQTASVAGDWIFVHFGDGASTGQAAGIVLKAGQHLLGEHAGLITGTDLNGNGTAQVIFPAAPGNRPRIDHSGAGNNAVSATDAIPTEIVGLSLQSSAANAVDLTLTGAFSGSGNLTILNNEVRGAGAEGIDVNSGGTGTLTLDVSGNLWNAAGTHTGNAIDVARTAGTLRLNLSSNTGIRSAATAVNVSGGAATSTTVTGFLNNTVHQVTGGSGIVVSNARFDADPVAAGYQLVAGGTTTVGVSGDGVGGAAMMLSSVNGDLAFTDLDLFGASGLLLSGGGAVNVGAGTGTRLTVPAGVATFNATAGPAVDVSGATIDLQLTGMTSSGSATTGVSLVNVADAASPAFPAVFSAPTGSTITGATGTAFNLDGGNATVTYNGTINNTAGRSVAVQNRTGDTATFTGGITDSGTGILLNANAAAVATNFQGGLSLTTGGNAAFTATSGGTLSICDENPCNPGATGILINTITTTTGAALNVSSTTIGANNLEFRSISSNGASNGITLNATGSAGGLKVKGTGSAGTGGTIQNITNRGASFIDAAGIELNWMNFTNAATTNGADPTNASSACGDLNVGGNLGCNAPVHLASISGIGGGPGAKLANLTINGSAQVGININNVTGLDLTNTTLTGIGNQVREFGLKGRNLKGTVTISGLSITGSFGENFRVENNDPPLAAVTVTGSTFGSATQGGGFFFIAQDDAQIDIDVSSSSFNSNFTTGLLVGVSDPASTSTCTANLDATGGPFNNNNAGIQVIGAGAADVTFNIHDITSISGNPASGIALDEADNSTSAGSMIGRIQNNVVTQPLSGSGNGIGVTARGAGTTTIAVTGNTVTNRTQYGIFLHRKEGLSPGTLNATVTGNNVTTTDVNGDLFFPIDGIRVEAGATAADTGTLCAQISGNTADGAQSAADNPSNFDLKLRHRFGVTYRLPGLVGSTSADAINLMNINNPAVDLIDATTTSSFTGGAACPTPP